MITLVINSGSSSIKYQLFDMKKLKLLCKGTIERIGEEAARLFHKKQDEEVLKKKVEAKTHKTAIRILLDALTDPEHGAISNIEDIGAIGHRVVHGAEEFSESVLITNRIVESVKKYNELAPLHNPPAISGIKACMEILPEIKQVAVFDTAFHQTMPDYAYLYALPIGLYKKYKIRRYGFHGTSHRYVAKKAADVLKKPLEKLKLITCHLGNGCSITAIDGGKSVDTSMGFTPLEGLVMGTRTGDIDPAIVFFLMKKEKLDPKSISDVLNKKSGLLGLSGVSNDMRDIGEEIKNGNKRAARAIEVFIYRIKKYIGAYIAAMNGVDAIVFTAGIGENQPFIKERIKKDLSFLTKATKARFLTVPTNEELLIAHDTYEIVKGSD